MRKQLLCTALLAMYLLGSHKGYLALWTQDREEPFQIFPVAVDTLPEADQQALAKGIPARSQIELSSLLEDFLS